MLRIFFRLAITHKRLSLLILLFVGLGVGAYYFSSVQKPEASVVVNPKRTFDDLELRRSTHDDIVQTLGVPEQVYDRGGYTIYAYPSTTSYYSPDLLYLKDDVLEMKELNYTPLQFVYTRDKLVNNFGNPDSIAYLPGEAYVDYVVYIYEKDGIAAYLNADSKVFRLRYFWPSTSKAYIQTWDRTLTETKPTPAEAEAHD